MTATAAAAARSESRDPTALRPMFAAAGRWELLLLGLLEWEGQAAPEGASHLRAIRQDSPPNGVAEEGVLLQQQQLSPDSGERASTAAAAARWAGDSPLAVQRSREVLEARAVSSWTAVEALAVPQAQPMAGLAGMGQPVT